MMRLHGCLLLVAAMLVGCQVAHHSIDVASLGAAGDGKTLCTSAFQKALDDCKDKGGEVVVPPGNYLIGSVVMGSNTTLRLDKGATLIGSPNADDYPLMEVRWEGRWREGHRALIHAKDATNIAIVGDGTINGDMDIGDLRDPRGPCIFEPIECKSVRIEGIHINYRRMWSVHLTYCENVVARNLTIRSTRANGDGIDVDSSRDVTIDHCDIDTGDDSIALKSGRGMEGVRIARPTENVTITNCTLGSAFAGLALGTEMSGGIRNIRCENCTFPHGSNSIFIKSRTDRGGFMEDIDCRNLTVTGAKSLLRLDVLTKGIADSDPVQGNDGIARVGKIRIDAVKVDTDFLVDAKNTSPDKPVQGFSISNVTGACKRAIVLNHIKDAQLSNIGVSGFDGPFLITDDVTGPAIDQIHSPRDTVRR
jgi:polygalacturonase